VLLKGGKRRAREWMEEMGTIELRAMRHQKSRQDAGATGNMPSQSVKKSGFGGCTFDDAVDEQKDDGTHY